MSPASLLRWVLLSPIESLGRTRFSFFCCFSFPSPWSSARNLLVCVARVTTWNHQAMADYLLRFRESNPRPAARETSMWSMQLRILVGSDKFLRHSQMTNCPEARQVGRGVNWASALTWQMRQLGESVNRANSSTGPRRQLGKCVKWASTSSEPQGHVRSIEKRN